MEKVICDQLFVNDTNIDSQIILNITKSLGVQCVLLSKLELQQAMEYIDLNFGSGKTLILPGAGSKIFTDVLGLDFDVGTYIDVKRKIDPGTLTPRGILTDDSTNKILGGLIGDIFIGDDVIASGTTINGIYKRLGNSVKTCKAIALILREKNQVNKNIGIEAGFCVSKKDDGYPRINTLSTLQQNNQKKQLVLDGFRINYGDNFANEIQTLFTF